MIIRLRCTEIAEISMCWRSFYDHNPRLWRHDDRAIVMRFLCNLKASTMEILFASVYPTLMRKPESKPFLAEIKSWQPGKGIHSKPSWSAITQANLAEEQPKEDCLRC